MININKIYGFLFSILLLLLINVPTVYKEIKIIFTLMLLAIVIYKLFQKDLHLHKDVFLLFSVSLLFGSIFIFNGVIHSNPGVLPSISVIIVWPTLYILLIAANGYNNIFKNIEKVFLYSAYFIPIYGLYFLLSKINIIPPAFFINIFPEDVMGGVGLYKGSIEVSILNLASVLFIGHYMLASFLLKDKKKDKIVYGIAIFLLLGFVLLSGRRALLVVIFFSFFLIFLLTPFIKNNTIRKSIRIKLNYLIVYAISSLFILSIIILSYYNVDFYKIYEEIIEGFSFGSSNDPSTNARTEQFISLINGFSNSPVIGNGFGAVASVIRNDKMPWSYELSYISLLFHTGIVGFLIYFLLTIWIIIESLKISKDISAIKYIFPYIVGMISFLIGNMSNPYLMKFDYLWVIFIPVMYINYYRLHKKRK